MSKQGWQEVFVIGQTDGAALTASVTPTSIIPAAARFTLPPNFFSEVGKAIRVRGAGRVTTVTTPGTLTLDIRLGPTGNIVVFNGGAMALNATAQTNATWEFEATLICRSIGAGARGDHARHRLVGLARPDRLARVWRGRSRQRAAARHRARGRRPASTARSPTSSISSRRGEPATAIRSPATSSFSKA